MTHYFSAGLPNRFNVLSELHAFRYDRQWAFSEISCSHLECVPDFRKRNNFLRQRSPCRQGVSAGVEDFIQELAELERAWFHPGFIEENLFRKK